MAFFLRQRQAPCKDEVYKLRMQLVACFLPFCRTFLAPEMETPLVLGSQRQGSQSKEKLARPPHIWTERKNAMTKSQKRLLNNVIRKRMIQVLLTSQACRQSSSHPHLETLERKTIFNMGRALYFGKFQAFKVKRTDQSKSKHLPAWNHLDQVQHLQNICNYLEGSRIRPSEDRWI